MSTAASGGARKTMRLDVRVRPDVKKIIDQAADVLGVSTSDFASATLVAEAQSVLERHQRIVLSNAEWERLLQSLASEEAPNEALMEAARSYNARYEKR